MYLQGPYDAASIGSYFMLLLMLMVNGLRCLYISVGASADVSCWLRIATGPVATTSVVPGSVAICFAASDYIAILFLLLFIMFLLV